jgi:hypothetical protein
MNGGNEHKLPAATSAAGRWHLAFGDASVGGSRDAELGAILGPVQQPVQRPSAIATAPLDEPDR